MKCDERNPNFFLKPPFLFPWQLRQSLSNRFQFFFGLSRSIRCGCCSYQVSSISVPRVICYDHFCVFHFWKKSTFKSTTSYSIWYSYKVS
jgi:hypothetical protein